VGMNISGDQWVCSKCTCLSSWTTNMCNNCREPSPIGVLLQQYSRQSTS
jgi:hypothetical protein